GMIGNCLNSIYLKCLGNLLNLFPAQTINNSALALILFYEPDYVRIDIFRFWPNFIVKIWSIKGSFKSIGIRHPEIFKDVLLYFGSRRCSKTDDWNVITYTLDNAFQVSVFRPKIVPPFADAMRLINSQKRDFLTVEK